MAEAIYDVEITDWINKKINAKKPGITADEVWSVCYEPKRHTARWHDHPVHGRRLMVIGHTPKGRLLRIILHPVDVELGKWRLKTALAENSKTRG